MLFGQQRPIFLYQTRSLSGIMRALAENPTREKTSLGRRSDGKGVAAEVNSDLGCRMTILLPIFFRTQRA